MRSHQRQLARQGRAQKAISTFDAGYDPIQRGLGVVGEPNGQVLMRLRAGRCFYAEPPNTPTGGRPKRHGATFACDDPATWPEPTDEWKGDDPQYGGVRLRAWSGLHAIPATHGKHPTPHAKPIVTGWLIRLEVERLPKPTKLPEPLWLWWWGAAPPSLELAWQIYVARFAIEHTFRFFKQVRKLDDPQTPFARSR